MPYISKICLDGVVYQIIDKVTPDTGGNTPIASTTVAGKVKPDGDTILIEKDGLIKINLNKVACLDSPNLIGVPTVPTAEEAISNNQVASTAYVHNVINTELLKIENELKTI